MDAISMVTISSLVAKLRVDFPQFRYEKSSVCSWDPTNHTILYTENTDPSQVLHELGHALLGHESFTHDISLLSIERAAWVYAKTNLAASYSVSISNGLIEESLDSYRDWIHKRSLCPHCEVNGVQQTKTTYHCTVCDRTWKVNDARSCQLRRTVIRK